MWQCHTFPGCTIRCWFPVTGRLFHNAGWVCLEGNQTFIITTVAVKEYKVK